MFRQFAPAPCSPPLGGSDAGSAVRFTPAVKYGGRENRLSGRATSCMSGHPCRAHHKLEWARKRQSVLGVLYENLSRSESGIAAIAQITPKLRRPSKFRKVTPVRHGLATAPRVCLKKGNPQVRVDFASVQGINPKA